MYIGYIFGNMYSECISLDRDMFMHIFTFFAQIETPYHKFHEFEKLIKFPLLEKTCWEKEDEKNDWRKLSVRNKE